MVHKYKHSIFYPQRSRTSTVGASSSFTRRILAEIVYMIYYEIWPVFILEYELKG